MDNFHFQCLGGAGNNAFSASFALVFLNSHNAILAVNHIKVAALHTDTEPNTRIGTGKGVSYNGYGRYSFFAAM